MWILLLDKELWTGKSRTLLQCVKVDENRTGYYNTYETLIRKQNLLREFLSRKKKKDLCARLCVECVYQKHLPSLWRIYKGLTFLMIICFHRDTTYMDLENSSLVLKISSSFYPVICTISTCMWQQYINDQFCTLRRTSIDRNPLKTFI